MSFARGIAIAIIRDVLFYVAVFVALVGLILGFAWLSHHDLSRIITIIRHRADAETIESKGRNKPVIRTRHYACERGRRWRVRRVI